MPFLPDDSDYRCPHWCEVTEKKAWIEGTNSADRILKETIREAMLTLSQESFMKWLRGFVA